MRCVSTYVYFTLVLQPLKYLKCSIDLVKYPDLERSGLIYGVGEGRGGEQGGGCSDRVHQYLYWDMLYSEI